MPIGIDLVYLPEFKEKLNDVALVERIFHPSELEQSASLESRAGVFAAKEACIKAIGKKIDWLDISIEKQASGKPILSCTHIDSHHTEVSISHAGEYVTSIVIIDK